MTPTEILRSDLERLAPGCRVSVRTTPAGGWIADLEHRTTGRKAEVRIADGLYCGPDEWRVTYGRGSGTTGTSAYGFDSALIHAYRHELDFDSEHGPGAAWDYHKASA